MTEEYNAREADLAEQIAALESLRTCAGWRILQRECTETRAAFLEEIVRTVATPDTIHRIAMIQGKIAVVTFFTERRDDEESDMVSGMIGKRRDLQDELQHARENAERQAYDAEGEPIAQVSPPPPGRARGGRLPL